MTPDRMDPVRRQFGAFGRFRRSWATWAWRFILVCAGSGGCFLALALRPDAGSMAPAGLGLVPLGGLLGAVLGSMALPAQRDSGTWDPLILTTYPRGALARALLFGTLARSLTLLAVPTLAWVTCALCVARAEDVPAIVGALLLVPIGTHLGVCLGGDASVKAQTLQGAVVRAGLGTLFFLYALSQAAFLVSMLLALVVPAHGILLATAVLAWPAWIALYRRLFFGMLAEYFEPDWD